MNVMNRITLKSLLKNRTRTIVTIIGVILSAAMITAVTTLIASLQAYTIDYTIYTEGDWHAVFEAVTLDDYQSLLKEEDLEDVVAVRTDGFAILQGSGNPYKPYLRIMEMQKEAFEHMPVRLIEGRLPQNENEVVISEHILSNGGVEYKIGDTLTLSVGQRMLKDGTVLSDKDAIILNEDGTTEESLVTTKERTFTVVGICERTSYTLEGYSSPGYTIFTTIAMDRLNENDGISVYYRAKKTKDIFSLTNQLGEKYAYSHYRYNDDYLRYMGISNDNNYIRVLYSLGAILIGLIMIGSITLIYNSFAISVSERRKQFGLLTSVGATAKQRMNSVFFESLVIASIGIPIGIGAGLAGIGITLYLLREQLLTLFGGSEQVALKLTVSTVSIVTSIIVAIITILISAYIPAKRSKKASAMDAIRQTEDIKLKARQVKTLRITRKLIGMEGDLALKNFKRNRRRYRSTVISLFISVVLFIAASSFAMYLKDSVVNVYMNTEYDLSVYFNDSSLTLEANDKIESVFDEILALEDIKEGSVIRGMYGYVDLAKEQVEETYYSQRIERGERVDGDKIQVGVYVYSVNQKTFTTYAEELGLDPQAYSNPEAPVGIVIDKQHYYDPMEERYMNSNLLKEGSLQSISLYNYFEEQTKKIMDVSVGAFAETAPFGILDYADSGSIILILNEQIANAAFAALGDEWYGLNMYFASDNPDKSEKDIKDILYAANIRSIYIFNQAEALQANRNIILVISVFSYGFIVLISLITIANVFNTISTNVNLRRREFAMLKSVGMTQKGFNKMLNFECIFYGLKALAYGIPVAIGVTYLIYLSVNNGVDMKFYLPTSSMIISIFSVFLVVFISMMYSMSKIRNENILDALKSEIN